MSDKKPTTYRQNEITGEWEQAPKREPLIASWDAFWIFAVTVACGLAAGVIVRLFIWSA